MKKDASTSNKIGGSLGAHPKHVVQAEAADIETKKASTSVIALKEMTMMSLEVFVEYMYRVWGYGCNFTQSCILGWPYK